MKGIMIVLLALPLGIAAPLSAQELSPEIQVDRLMVQADRQIASEQYDVLGNVGEWTQDCWNESYSGALADGSAWSSGDCSERVYRSVSWGDFPANLRSAYRSRLPAGWRGAPVG